MARKQQEIELIATNSFMGLLASKNQIPGVVGVEAAPELRRTGRLFEVVGRKEAKSRISFRIVRPSSWGGNVDGGAFAH